MKIRACGALWNSSAYNGSVAVISLFELGIYGVPHATRLCDTHWCGSRLADVGGSFREGKASRRNDFGSLEDSRNLKAERAPRQLKNHSLSRGSSLVRRPGRQMMISPSATPNNTRM
jgi:hypothetical protein